MDWLYTECVPNKCVSILGYAVLHFTILSLEKVCELSTSISEQIQSQTTPLFFHVITSAPVPQKVRGSDSLIIDFKTENEFMSQSETNWARFTGSIPL